jgi:hypothetical protein
VGLFGQPIHSMGQEGFTSFDGYAIAVLSDRLDRRRVVLGWLIGIIGLGRVLINAGAARMSTLGRSGRSRWTNPTGLGRK